MFEKGGLGNQLFQLAGLRAFYPQEKILLVGMVQLRTAFESDNLLNASPTPTRLETVFRWLGYERLHAIAQKFGGFNLMSERHENGRSHAYVRKRPLSFAALCRDAYFQDAEVPPMARPPELRPEHRAKSASFVSALEAKHECGRRHLYFLHQRRGDYLSWPCAQTPACLPQAWYEDQIRFVRSRDPMARFVVLGDDRTYLLKHYSNRRGFIVSQESEPVDLGIMSFCKGGGILSASSFSWWGAYLSYLNTKTGLFIAPQHWIGHPVGEWYPPAIETKWMIYAPALT